MSSNSFENSNFDFGKDWFEDFITVEAGVYVNPTNGKSMRVIHSSGKYIVIKWADREVVRSKSYLDGYLLYKDGKLVDSNPRMIHWEKTMRSFILIVFIIGASSGYFSGFIFSNRFVSGKITISKDKRRMCIGDKTVNRKCYQLIEIEED